MTGFAHPAPLESFAVGWPVARADGRDDLRRFIAEPAYRTEFRLPGGQFALCERDPSSGIVAVLRDPSATLPLHAHHDGRQWLVSTSVRAIERETGRPFALRLEVLGQLHQTFRLATDRSLYQDVHLIGPGAVHLLHPDGSVRRFDVCIEWPDRGEVRRLACLNRHRRIEMALEQVQRSVRDAAGGESISVQLSGGRDSNLILHTASHLGLPVRAHGMVFPGLACDESGPMQTSCRMAGVALTAVDYAGAGYEHWKDELFRLAEYPPFTTSFMSLQLARCARDEGLQVVLNGMGGDEIFVCPTDRAIALWTRLGGACSVGSIPASGWARFLRALGRVAWSGRDASLRGQLVSGGWYFQMCVSQLLMETGCELRLPFRDWRLVVRLLPLIAAAQLVSDRDARAFQDELLDALEPGLVRVAGLGKAVFNEVGLARGPEDPELGGTAFGNFARLLPEFRDALKRMDRPCC
ncbi:MAG: hypothetical protein Kow0020_00240 [Wenzhouxiangellaceae bacterium]